VNERLRLDRPWNATLDVVPGVGQRLRVSEADGALLVAEFSGHPSHPRALLFVLEGLALWKGTPLCVAIRAAAPVSDSLGLGGFGDDWPRESALVHFRFVDESPSRRLRLRRSRRDAR
jgi:hypothetical protein